MSAEVMVAPVMTEEQAERITEQIAYRIDSITENYEVVMSLMRDALARRAHEALGYPSPGAYIADRFGRSLQTLGAALRREFVHELSDAGLSTRAIAPVFGVTHTTVANDIKAGVKRFTPEVYEPVPAEQMIRSTYGDDYVDEVLAEGVTVDTRTVEVLEEEPVVEHTITEKVKTITGLDGKTYTQKPREPKPAPTGDEANRVNAIQSSNSIGRSLEALQPLNYERARIGIVTEWWPIGRHEVPPEQAAYFTPAELRKLAQGLLETADLLEAHHVH